MVIDMNESRLNTVAQLRAFLEGTLEVQFCPLHDDTQRYAFIGALLKRLRYAQLRRADKGVVLRYLERTTGYSRQQLTRLVGRARNGSVLAKRYRVPAHGFARKFSPIDVALLAETDALHATLSGPATVHLLRRAYTLYGDPRYQRLAALSVSHLYNLRAQAGYRAKRGVWTKTKGASVAIGQRRAPVPEGRAGFIRIDSVHQGDFDGLKGVYHINAVDCVTQFELVATCERISEAYLLPVLEQLLEDFPFTILGFHADNGSEYINHTVAKLLKKLHIELTKSRPRTSNDNALAETKNAAIVRKHLGYAHIPQRWATQVNAFCRQFLNPYVNFCHRRINTPRNRRLNFPQSERPVLPA
jgi:transposase InsO family protein